jgi:tetratricopeptide (TPR) repeat protein
MQNDLIQRASRAYAEHAFGIAVELADEAVAENPRNADALHLRGLIALALRKPEDARTWLARAIELSAHPGFCNSLCVTQMHLRDFPAAAQSARLGLRIADERFPDYGDIALLWFNLGLALQLDEQMEAAAQSYRRALGHRPDHAASHNNLGAVLNRLGDLDSAIEHTKAAIALDPDNLEAHSNLGHALLAAGRYDEAWPHFEHRWASFQTGGQTLGARAPELPIPLWRGGPLPAGASLLVLHEQGFGDALQFCRYLPMALERFARVGYVCPAPLRRLFEESLCARWPNIVLVDGDAVDLSMWTHHCPLMSLPMCFGTRIGNIPAPTPYLRANSQRARFWAERIGERSMPAVGLVWAGGHTHSRGDKRRSIAPETLAPLLSYRGVRWISLQKAEHADKQLPPAFAGQIADWMDRVGDFADTAALIDGLDLVIAVDTSVAHLAAAMGKRVWLLNRFAGCWRWLRDRDDTPWYPDMRLFTQTKRGDWTDVLTRVRTELENLGERVV